MPSQLRVVTSPVAAISSAIRTAAGVTGPAPVDTTTCSVAVVSAKPWIWTCGTPRGPITVVQRWWNTESVFWEWSAVWDAAPR